MSSKFQIVSTYACHTLDSLIAAKTPGIVTQSDLALLSDKIVESLLRIISSPSYNNNEYVSKCLFRVCMILTTTISPFVDQMVKVLTRVLDMWVQDHVNSRFAAHVLDTFGIIIRVSQQGDERSVKLFESILFPIFDNIISKDIHEIFPHITKLLGIMISLQDRQYTFHNYKLRYPSLVF